jgi:hypothetical protein
MNDTFVPKMIVASEQQYMSQKMEKNAWTLGLSEYIARSL